MERSDDEAESGMQEEKEEMAEEVVGEEDGGGGEVVYYGERKCQASRTGGSSGSSKSCTNNAYFAQPKGSSVHRAGRRGSKRKQQVSYLLNKKKSNTDTSEEEEEEEEEELLYLCGVHAKDKLRRRALPKRDPKERKRLEQARIEADRVVIEQHRARNQAAGRRGDVVLERLRMLKAPQRLEGYLRVYPNFKHQNKADGFGCRRLSPMSLGPVEHGQPGLPAALNIENFHQGTKVFPQELDADGNPSSAYVANRLRFYEDPVPHRHKYRASATTENRGNRNVPAFFLWIDRRGGEHRLSYVASRQFYCNFYERLASVEPDFQHLLELVEAGTNLQLCGYDACPLPAGQTLEEAYLDPSVPFGHERVLYAMLLLHDRPDEYPWRKHKTFDF